VSARGSDLRIMSGSARRGHYPKSEKLEHVSGCGYSSMVLRKRRTADGSNTRRRERRAGSRFVYLDLFQMRQSTGGKPKLARGTSKAVRPHLKWPANDYRPSVGTAMFGPAPLVRASLGPSCASIARKATAAVGSAFKRAHSLVVAECCYSFVPAGAMKLASALAAQNRRIH
jgi:hypothetical protein